MQHHCWVMLKLVKSEFLEEATSNVIFKNFEVGQKLEHFTTIEANGAEFDSSLIFMVRFIFSEKSLKTAKIKVASLTSVFFPFN